MRVDPFTRDVIGIGAFVTARDEGVHVLGGEAEVLQQPIGGRGDLRQLVTVRDVDIDPVTCLLARDRCCGS